MRYEYQKIGFKRSKKGICPVCRKQASRTEEFCQTINPWNQKTAEQILDEENSRAATWLQEPTIHEKCEIRIWRQEPHS